jgi:hypothetical protein
VLPLLPWEKINIIYFDFMSVALVILPAPRMRRILLSAEACPVLQYFSTLSHKRQDNQGGDVNPSNIKLCLDFLYSFCLKHF